MFEKSLGRANYLSAPGNSLGTAMKGNLTLCYGYSTTGTSTCEKPENTSPKHKIAPNSLRLPPLGPILRPIVLRRYGASACDHEGAGHGQDAENATPQKNLCYL